MNAALDNQMNGILEYVKERRAIDFSSYREGTIRRRIAARLAKAGMPDCESYLGYLKENPKEIDALIEALTIKLSYFFRDPLVFEALRHFVIPSLVDIGKEETIRIWCAGCARGEEPYSVAILMKDFFCGEGVCRNVFILATDIDRDALRDAASGIYKADALNEVKKGWLDEYFTKEGDNYRLKESIRSMVAFAYHDITAGASPAEGVFSDYHLIFCRNTLIYFERDMQEKVLQSLYESLLDGGYLALGEAESLSGSLAEAFREIIPGTKIFRKGGSRS
jgi:chemotaxis methyl-accepting protein methylase